MTKFVRTRMVSILCLPKVQRFVVDVRNNVFFVSYLPSHHYLIIGNFTDLQGFSSLILLKVRNEDEFFYAELFSRGELRVGINAET